MADQNITTFDNLALPEEAFALLPDLPPGTPFDLINIQLGRLNTILNVLYNEYSAGEKSYSDAGMANIVEISQLLLDSALELIRHGENTQNREASA